MVCDRSEAFASGCAVSRAFPLFSRKTSKSNANGNGSADVGGRTSADAVRVETRVEFLSPSADGDGGGGGAATGTVVTEDELQALQAAANGIRLAAKIVDTPCNEMHTDAFVQVITEVGKELGIRPTVVRGEELRKRGFGGIYGVGKASVHPPALAVLSHTPEGATETIAWVGKGIVYDTGGLSIKAITSINKLSIMQAISRLEM